MRDMAEQAVADQLYQVESAFRRARFQHRSGSPVGRVLCGPTAFRVTVEHELRSTRRAVLVLGSSTYRKES